MGSSSSSSSTTSQTTTAINPVVIADNGSLSVSGVAGGNLSQVVNNTTLDADVANHAMDNMLTSNQDSLLFANDAMRRSYKFSTGVNDSAFAFAGETNKSANATSAKAMDSASATMDKAFAYGSKQTAVALDALAGSATMIDTAYKDAKGVLGTNVILAGMGAVVLVLFFALRKH
jgi:hypothetical protein